MLIQNGRAKQHNENTFVYDNERFHILLEGVLYIPGFKLGLNSALQLAESIQGSEVKDIAKARGDFFIYIYQKEKKRSFIFADNNGIFKVFFHEEIISSSFLTIVRNKNFSEQDLSLSAISEFIKYGSVYENKTFLNTVRKFPKNEIWMFDANGNKKIIKKPLQPITQPEQADIINHFKCFVDAIDGQNISVDITGGNDTRLVMSVLHYLGLEFELGISGVRGIKDIEIPSRISNIINRKLHITYHKDNITNQLVEELFDTTDAQTNVIDFHRNYQYLLEQKERGFDFLITGNGGAMYNDLYWLQDFPWYNKRRSDINRLFSWRVIFDAMQYPFDILGDKIKPIAEGIKQKIIKDLAAYTLPVNTQTYDNIYYNYVSQATLATHTTIYNKLSNTYAPLLDFDLVRHLFNLPRSARFYNNYHRKYVTKCCPEIANLLNTLDVTVSAKNLQKFLDMFRYIYNIQKRFARKLFQKKLRKTYFQEESPDNLEVFLTAQNLDITKNALETLKQKGFLAKNVNSMDLEKGHLGRFVTLGMFLQELK